MKATLLSRDDAVEFLKKLAQDNDNVITDDVDYVLIVEKPITQEKEWDIYHITMNLAVYATKCYETDTHMICAMYHA